MSVSWRKRCLKRMLLTLLPKFIYIFVRQEAVASALGNVLCKYLKRLKQVIKSVSAFPVSKTKYLKNDTSWLILDTPIISSVNNGKASDCFIFKTRSKIMNSAIKISVFHIHCVKSVHIYSFSSPCFSAFGLNAERYSEHGHFSHSDLFRSWFKILCFHCAYIFGELSALSLF